LTASRHYFLGFNPSPRRFSASGSVGAVSVFQGRVAHDKVVEKLGLSKILEDLMRDEKRVAAEFGRLRRRGTTGFVSRGRLA